MTLLIELGHRPGSETVKADGQVLGHIARLDLHVDCRYAELAAAGNFEALAPTREALLNHGFVVNAQRDEYGCYERRHKSPDLALATMMEKAMCHPVMVVEHDRRTLESTWIVRWEPR